MDKLQQQYDDLIRARDPDQVRSLWEKTGVPPDEQTLQLLLDVGIKVQECMDIHNGRCVQPNTPPATEYWNLFADIKGVGGREEKAA